MAIFYVPLEPYKERYTIQLSAVVDGWFTDVLDRLGTDFVYVRGEPLRDDTQIKTGSVLDACGRGYWACSQVMRLLEMLDSGEIDNGDVIYFEDFWTPGFSAIPYAIHLLGIDVKLYALLHAQSIDQYDFTHSMAEWMRGFEVGETFALSGVFVTSYVLKELMLKSGLVGCPIYVTGLPYNSKMVKKFFVRMGGATPAEKEDLVVFTSRWDKEKDPTFFIKVAEHVYKTDPNIKFVVTTSRGKLSGNDGDLNMLANLIRDGAFPNMSVAEGLSKVEYYEHLARAKVQFNCADQDFVSWTLLEATTFGCFPVYPDYLSFPEVLPEEFLYAKGHVEDAANLVMGAVHGNGRLSAGNPERVHSPFDKAAERMTRIMEGDTEEMAECSDRKSWLPWTE